MASFVPGKTKRKGFDEVYDDFSSLSLSAPAAKIRRLDAELLPMMEMGERERGHQHFQGFTCDAVANAPLTKETSILSPPVNEERALVLYKPIHPQFGLSLQMDPELISGLKNPAHWPGNQNFPEDIVEEQESSSVNSLAVIPWVPSVPSPSWRVSTSATETVEEDAMEAIEDCESMEIEGECGKFIDPGVGDGGFHQWQQHCIIPEFSQITSTPILGSW